LLILDTQLDTIADNDKNVCQLNEKNKIEKFIVGNFMLLGLPDFQSFLQKLKAVQDYKEVICTCY
jgi:hypothetical protein